MIPVKPLLMRNPTVAATTYRYLRFSFPDGAQGGGTDRVALREIEIAETIGGSNVITVFSSSAVTQSSILTFSYNGYYAFDLSRTGDGWCSANSSAVGAWLQYDFVTSAVGRKVACKEIRATQGWSALGPSPAKIVVLGSDDSTFATYDTLITSASGLTWAESETKTFTV